MCEIQLTRYLYVKKEVEIALLLSILNKSEEAIFWAYELYYSGFKKELALLLFQIYYDFFACLNPKFEKYLCVKLKNNLNDCETNPELISSIIHNFNYRPFTLDVFMLKQIEACDDFSLISENMNKLLAENNHMGVCKMIMNNNDLNHKQLFDIIVRHFYLNKIISDIQLQNQLKDFEKICKNMNINKPNVILSRYLYFVCLQKDKKMGKNVIITIDPEDVVLYETIQTDIAPRKILKTACLYKITDVKHIKSFYLDHRNPFFKDNIYFKWHYWASFSPLWRERIQKYGGIIDHEKQDILFPNDDAFEDYFNKFGLEPDEQSKETQNCFMGEPSHATPADFYSLHRENSIISIDTDLINNIDKFNY